MNKREKVIKGLECCVIHITCSANGGCPYKQSGSECLDVAIKDAIALLKAQEPQWTPITFRPLTEEEKAEHPDWCYIIDSPTPDDGEDILVSNGRAVWADVWGNNGVECYLESDHELEGVAWMKMPTPWKKEANA
jgi:hypothetical protein